MNACGCNDAALSKPVGGTVEAHRLTVWARPEKLHKKNSGGAWLTVNIDLHKLFCRPLCWMYSLALMQTESGHRRMHTTLRVCVCSCLSRGGHWIHGYHGDRCSPLTCLGPGSWNSSYLHVGWCLSSLILAVKNTQPTFVTLSLWSWATSRRITPNTKSQPTISTCTNFSGKRTQRAQTHKHTLFLCATVKGAFWY